MVTEERMVVAETARYW
jgi:uncharacterized membrane protein HdeD (DUF308 family)